MSRVAENARTPARAEPGPFRQRIGRIVISLAVAGALIAFGFRGADLAAVGRAFRQAHPGYLALAVALSLLTFVARAFRWRALVVGLKPSVGFGNLFSCTVIGFAMSYVLPLRVGELARPLLLARRERISRGSAIATVAVARMMDFLAVLVLFSVYLIGFSHRLPAHGSEFILQFRSRGILIGAALLAAGVALYAAVFLRVRLFRALETRTAAGGTGRRLVDSLHALVRGFEVLKGGRALALALVLTFLTWCLIDWSILAGLKAFGIPADFADVFLLMAFLAVGIAVPTPAGLGSYQAAGLVCLEQFFGVARETALAAIWAEWGIAVVPVVALAALLIWREGLSFGQIGRLVGRSQEASP